MEIQGWKYYNHAAIPSTPPHKEPDLSPIEDKSIWKIDDKTPLLVRWTTEFDCGYETNWWYLIREAPFDIEEIPSKERKSIRSALKKCYIKKINPSEYIDELYLCYSSAFSKYENAGNMNEKENFLNLKDNVIEYWAGFDNETNKLIGYITVSAYDMYAEIHTAKFDPDYFNRQASDALYYNVLNHYLNECGKKYICSGSRNINHKTGTQEYKIRRFGYKKAYCHLHIEYNPKIKVIIKILYKFRKLLMKMDKITLIHQINAVLKMEEIIREK
ncbi:MAG: hypothetical protein J6K17_13900 [Oscillospiraceae bacterium]|nr:hypothetical protein [Oscillospiraceae bacterium]